MSHLDTLLEARLAGRRQQGSFWSSSARGILVIAALNIVLLWSVTGGVIWQSYRDAADDWKRTAANFTLTTAAYAQQTLVATDLMLRSMLDWIADEDITSETQFTDVMKQRRFHEAIRDRLVWPAAGQRRLDLQQGGPSPQLVERLAGAIDLYR